MVKWCNNDRQSSEVVLRVTLSFFLLKCSKLGTVLRVAHRQLVGDSYYGKIMVWWFFVWPKADDAAMYIIRASLTYNVLKSRSCSFSYKKCPQYFFTNLCPTQSLTKSTHHGTIKTLINPHSDPPPRPRQQPHRESLKRTRGKGQVMLPYLHG